MNVISLSNVGTDDQSKTAQARKLIKSAILSQELSPGESVSERKLSVRFSIGRTPIREALKQLAFEGWFTSVPGAGLVVADYNYGNIQENFSVRAQLDAFAAATCAKIVTPEMLLKFNYYLSASDLAIRQKNWMQNVELESDFHKCIVACTGNSYLINLYELVAGHTPKSYYLQVNNELFNRTSLEEHRGIVEAIKEKDEQKASQRCITHMDRIIRAVQERAQKNRQDS